MIPNPPSFRKEWLPGPLLRRRESHGGCGMSRSPARAPRLLPSFTHPYYGLTPGMSSTFRQWPSVPLSTLIMCPLRPISQTSHPVACLICCHKSLLACDAPLPLMIPSVFRPCPSGVHPYVNGHTTPRGSVSALRLNLRCACSCLIAVSGRAVYVSRMLHCCCLTLSLPPVARCTCGAQCVLSTLPPAPRTADRVPPALPPSCAGPAETSAADTPPAETASL